MAPLTDIATTTTQQEQREQEQTRETASMHAHQDSRQHQQHQPRHTHAHGKRLACFRPRQRFRCDADADADDRFEHVEHADAREYDCDSGDDAGGAVANSSITSSSARRRVSSPLTKRQLKAQRKLAAEHLQLAQYQVTCDCDFQVYRCQLVHADDSWAVREATYVQRVSKWADKFDAHDWRHERVCQKWKENQQRYAVQARANDDSGDQGNDSSIATRSPRTPGRTVRYALSSFASAAEVLLLSRQFDALLRAGVPPHLRGRVWYMSSGAAEKQRAAGAESYSALVAQLHTLSRSACMEIEKDLPRTFPLDRTSGSNTNRSDSDELRRVLQAYSLRNPVIGYCQSMNFLAAVLLHHMGEEEAFWVLACVVEDLTPQYHTRSMAGSRADQRVFADLVQQKLPTLAAHLRALGVDFAPFTLKWFLCLFLHTLPFEPVLRLWDVLFCEGSHVLLRVGLVLLKLLEPRIVTCTDAFDVYELFTISHATLRELTAPHRTALLNRDECVCDTLVRLVMDKTFVGPIPFDSLHELRVYYMTEIEAEVAEVDARRAAVRAASASAASGLASSSSSSGGAKALVAPLSAEAQEMLEYDFLDEFAHDDDEDEDERDDAPLVHFRELYDSDASSSSDYFVDVVKVECPPSPPTSAPQQQRCR